MKKFWVLMISLFAVLVLTAQEPAQPQPKAEEPKAEETKAEEAKAEPDEVDPEEQVVTLTKDLEELKKGLEKRDAEIELLKKEFNNLKTKVEAPKVEEKVAEKKEEPKSPEKKDEKIVKFKPYGFFELAGYGTDSLFTYNDLMLFVNDENGSTSNISARNTRLGLDVSIPYVTAVDLSGKVEIDFLGGLAGSGMAESNVGMRMRHAYLKIGKTFKTGTTLSFIAGQTWATATIPIFPNLINPSYGWGKGNLWTRLPLAEIEVAQKAGPVDMGLKFAAAKPITGASANKGGFLEMNVDAGDVSHWPSLQGQLYLKAKFAGIDLLAAAGGAYGRENYVDGIKINNAETYVIDEKTGKVKKEDVKVYGDEVEVWMFNAALKVSHKYAEIQGKYFMGANLDMFGFFGGSTIKDADKYIVDSLKAQGYWAELSLKPYKGLKLSVGLSGEYTNHDDAVYDQNDAVWVSVFWTFFDHFTPGFQWEQIITESSPTEDNVTTEKKLTGNAFFGNVKFTF
ncbi:MAG TPA: DcaP family trimeric outer membrane transporter [bacterium]|nr:DcaP family trimeric outer membrane transporter [bacterium]